tara:strand:+ start:147 stop:617 length:471 start_codon:yes stop_codon:yes gene_type:complete
VNKDKLLKYAIDYLSNYDSSKKNLIIVLKRKIYKLKITDLERTNLLQILDKIILKLEEKNFINDKRYSLLKFSSLSRAGKSKNFIFNYLLKKGINKTDIQDVTKEIYENNSEWEINSAKTFAIKKRLFESKDTYEKKLAKMARAGFSYDICKKILN